MLLLSDPEKATLQQLVIPCIREVCIHANRPSSKYSATFIWTPVSPRADSRVQVRLLIGNYRSVIFIFLLKNMVSL